MTAGVAPVYRDDPRLEPLIGPGGPFEVTEVVVDGVPLRWFVRAPASILDAFRASRRHEDLVHVVFEEERLSFGAMRAQALSLARELKASFGVRPGDRVALAMRNFPEFVTGFWGAALVGAIVVPLNAWWSGPELTFAVEDCGATVVIADEERLQRMTGSRGAAAGEARLVAVRAADPSAYGSVPMDDLTAGAPLPDDEHASLDLDDPVTILYTSGTTGRPKGALGTGRGAIANLMNMAFMAARETVLTGRPPRPAGQPAGIAAAPLFHIGGMASIIGGAMSGSKIVLMRRWSVEEGLKLARAEGVTSLGGVPTIARQVLTHPGVDGLGLDIRTVPMGGAAVPPDLPRRALEVFGPSVQILNGYGMTETTSAVVTNVGSEYAVHLDSVGRPNLTADIRVEDPAGRVLGPGEVGELCIRSPQVVKGYWNRPADTAAALVDGWFHTGDLGCTDEAGFVYVVDRLKDVVIRGGENVYCAEVEAVLFEHPMVAEVAVVGLPDEEMGERVCAVVVPKEGPAPTLGELRDFARANLAAFKCPEVLHLAPEIPVTATGKVDKRELRASLISRKKEGSCS